jgi:diadenosine tetraphosphate (Ap4A) HIT family hydrolase
MNVAMLGNIVSQLHIHCVARYKTDEMWPAPVWGKGEVKPYNEQECDVLCQQLKAIFSDFIQEDD